MAGRQWQRDVAKERYWRRMVRRWNRSGLSVRDFCNEHVISEASFYAWRRELVKRDRAAAGGSSVERGAALVERGANSSAMTPPELPRFVPVQVIADIPARSLPAPCVEVLLPSGVQIRVPCGVDRQTLADVVSVLEQRSC